MKSSLIKFSHHHANLGPKYVENHVMTLARRIEDDKIFVGWAICTPGHWEPFEATLNTVNETEELAYTSLLKAPSAGYETFPTKEVCVRLQKLKVRGERQVRGDSFCKKTGREKALARLNSEPLVFDMKVGEHVLDTVLAGIAYHFHHVHSHHLAGEIARQVRLWRHIADNQARDVMNQRVENLQEERAIPSLGQLWVRFRYFLERKLAWL